MFPPKPGDGSTPKRYEIATSKPATPAGLKQTRAIAHEIEAQLIRDRFDWRPWLKGKQKPPELTSEWIEKFTALHWEKTAKTPSKLNSWHKDYELKFCHLPDAPLTLSLLRDTIGKRSKAGSRSRQGYAFTYRQLAEFAGLEGAAELAELGRGYSGGRGVNPRELPSDEAIAAAREKFQGGWLWAFEAMAIYGLRPHELFLVRDRLGEDPPLLEVPDETKTGFHIAFPVEPFDWALTTKILPSIKIEGRNNNQLGMAISQKFRSSNVGFKPYDLRHAYARRGFEVGFPPDFLAKSMGHSLEVHLKSYRAWWGEQPYLTILLG